MCKTNPHRHGAVRGLRALAPLIVLVLAVAPALAASKSAGYVDPQTFIDIAGGDENVAVQVTIGSWLIKPIIEADPDLKALAGGLESIEVVILDLSRQGSAARAKDVLRETESRLRKQGWERLVLVREEDAEVHVVVLGGEDRVEGLVAMVIDMGDNTLVFANIAGTIDLAALQRISETWDIPGLDEIDFDEDDDE